MLPARARPVPFCFHGFLPPPRTSPFSFVDAVPARRRAVCMRTMSARRARRSGSAKTVADNSIVPTSARACEKTGAVIGCVACWSGIGGSCRGTRGTPRAAGALADDHRRAVRAGYRTANEDQVLVGAHLDDLEVLDR